jgi:hypothetical protein
MKALEVSINGKVVGLYVLPEGQTFGAMVANVPRTHMRAQIMTATETEDWHWQLPDVKEGQVIGFRMVKTAPGSGVPPRITLRDEVEAAESESKELAKKVGRNPRGKLRRKR